MALRLGDMIQGQVEDLSNIMSVDGLSTSEQMGSAAAGGSGVRGGSGVKPLAGAWHVSSLFLGRGGELGELRFRSS